MDRHCLKEFGLKVHERLWIEKCVKGHGLTAFGIALVEWLSKSSLIVFQRE